MKFTKLRALMAAGLLAVSTLAGLAAFGASPIQLGGSIFPLTFISQSPLNLTDGFNQMLSLLNQQVAAFPPQNQGAAFSGTGGSLGTTFTPATTGTNPLVQTAYVDVAGLGLGTSTIENSGGYVFLQGISGRKIIPAGLFTMYASGSVATATTIEVACQTSTNFLAKFPIAMMANGSVVTDAYVSIGGASPSLNNGIVNGCAAGDGVILTYTGTAPTGASDYFINFPYVVQ